MGLDFHLLPDQAFDFTLWYPTHSKRRALFPARRFARDCRAFLPCYRKEIGRRLKLKPTENWWLMELAEQFGEVQPAGFAACSCAS